MSLSHRARAAASLLPPRGATQAQGFINERALVLIAYEVLKLVKVCHTHGILHGDIKPANFLMKHRQRNPLFSSDASLLHLPWLKMVDFGCSQLLEPDHRFTKRSGTPVYMAPEIFERNYHAEADLWSLGIMLYQLYAQRFPYWPTKDGCKDSNLDQVMAAVLETPIALDYGPWLNMSPAGRDFVSRCLVKDYSKRLTVDEGLQHAWFADVRAAIAAAPKPGAAAAHAGAAHVPPPAGDGGTWVTVPPPATSVFASSNNIVAHAMPGAAVAAVPGLSGMVTAGAHI